MLLSYIVEHVALINENENPSEEELHNDIEDFLNFLISKMENKPEKDNIFLIGVGIAPVFKKKEIKINLSDLKNLTNKNNWYDIAKGFLNLLEFLCLYALTETTFKNLLNIQGKTKEEELIEKIFERFPKLEKFLKASSYNKEISIAVWKFYTRLRDIYTHSCGIMTAKSKSDLLGGIKHNFVHIWKNLEKDNVLLYFLIKEDIEKVINKNQLEIGKIYLLNDNDVNIFRNFIIQIMESLKRVFEEKT